MTNYKNICIAGEKPEVPVEARLGSDLDTCKKEAALLAKDLNCLVRLIHNDKEFVFDTKGGSIEVIL